MCQKYYRCRCPRQKQWLSQLSFAPLKDEVTLRQQTEPMANSNKEQQLGGISCPVCDGHYQAYQCALVVVSAGNPVLCI